ncbi:MAG: peptidase M20, partial [Rubrivivax sp.]|nr:peptidase M20 [Rubrivivax sp.]
MNARDPQLPVTAGEAGTLSRFVAQAWDERIVPALTDYIAVPAKSPMFDADWAERGLIDQVVTDAAAWVEARRVPGLTLEVVRLPGRTPVIFFEVPATQADSTDTV